MAEKIYLADGFSAVGKEIGQWCANNRAHIFTGLAVSGTLATGVLSARSGMRSARKIDRKEEELGRRLTTKEKIALCGKDYILPAATCAVSMFGAVGSDVVNTRTIGIQNAALIASERAYEQLSAKTKEVLGEKKAKQVQDEIVKEKVVQSGMYDPDAFKDAPKCGTGTLYPWVDAYSMLPLWTNPDWVASTVKDMKALMRDLKPRGNEFDYYDKEIGVFYGQEWLSRIGYDKKVWKTPEREHVGWSRGFCEDGEDDDSLEYYTTTMEYSPGFAVTALHWETDPSDMRLGRLRKSSGMW